VHAVTQTDCLRDANQAKGVGKLEIESARRMRCSNQQILNRLPQLFIIENCAEELLGARSSE
jgi:hypothetical protein